ncbi:MAG: hypothetical protein JJT75_08545 [Opitutales bacterium]|nr:hypothetical protein [Opitutales bacterium]
MPKVQPLFHCSFGRMGGLFLMVVAFATVAWGKEEDPYAVALYYSSGSADMAVLLEIQLSQEGVVIQDRREMEARWFEQAILGDAAETAIPAQVDALLFLERWQGRAEDSWMVRLVKSPSGSLLEIRSLPWSPASPEQADALLSNIEDALYRTKMSEVDQRVLSILPFRIEEGQRISGHWAERFPSMLANALTREPALTVLERWRVGDVAWERVLAGETPMFKADLVLRGTFRKGDEQELIVFLTVEDPKTQMEVWEDEIRGNQEEPKILLEKIVEKLQSADLIAKQHGQTIRGRESELFLREAIRAGRIQDFSRKIEAAEAAWFLRHEVSPELLYSHTKAILIQHLGERFGTRGSNLLKSLTVEESLEMARDFTEMAHMLHRELPPLIQQENDDRLLRNLVFNVFRGMGNALVVFEAHRKQGHLQAAAAQVELRGTIRALYRDLWKSASTNNHQLLLTRLGEILIQYGRHWFVENPEDFLPLLSGALLNYQDSGFMFRIFRLGFSRDEDYLTSMWAPPLWDENRSTPEERIQIWKDYWKTWDHEDPFIRDFLLLFSQYRSARRSSTMEEYQEKAEALLWKYREELIALPSYRRFIRSAPRPFRNPSQETRMKFLEAFLKREDAAGLSNIYSLFPVARNLPEDSLLDVLGQWEEAEERWNHGQHLTGSDKIRFHRYGDSLRMHAGKDFPLPPVVIPSWRSWAEMKDELKAQTGLALEPASPRFMDARKNTLSMLWKEKDEKYLRYHRIYFNLATESFLPGPVSPLLVPANQLEEVMENGEVLVYLLNGGAALVFNKKQGDWHWLEIPLKYNPRYALKGNKLLMAYSHLRPWHSRYNLNEDSAVLEIDLIRGDVEVLVSTGRNPPHSELDRQQRLREAQPFFSADGQRGLFYNNHIYLYEAESDDWFSPGRAPRKGQMAEVNGHTVLVTEDRGAFYWWANQTSEVKPFFPDLPLRIQPEGTWEFPSETQSDEIATGYSHQYAFNDEWFIVRRAFPLGDNWEWILKVYPRENDGMEPFVYRLLVEEFNQANPPGIARWHLEALPPYQWLHLTDDHFYQSTPEGIVRLPLPQLIEQE